MSENKGIFKLLTIYKPSNLLWSIVIKMKKVN